VGGFICGKLGKPYFELLIVILFLLSAAGLILYLKRAALGKIRLLIFIGVFIAGSLFAWHLDILVKMVKVVLTFWRYIVLYI